MKLVKEASVFSLLLVALCGCEEQLITRQEPMAPTSQVVASPAPAALGDIIGNVPSLPTPTIIEQTYVPAEEFFAHTRCRAWQITWPTYAVGTDPNKIPTVFSITNGSLNSFSFLNNTVVTNTYKATFNLYHNTKLETANTLWDELIHTFNAGEKMETTFFKKSKHSAASIETWVKGRPELFEIYWEADIIPPIGTEVKNYQQGDIYLFRRANQNRYGGIRIVSMTPRIMEVYSAEPNK